MWITEVHRWYRPALYIITLLGLARAQHGTVSYDNVVQYALTNTAKLEEIGSLLKNMHSKGQDEYRVGVIEEELNRTDDIGLQTWQEQTAPELEMSADGYEVVHDPSYVVMSRQLSDTLTALEKRIRAGQFDLNGDSDSEDENKPPPGEPYTLRHRGPYFDLIKDEEYHINKLTDLNKLNEKILATTIKVPTNFYKTDLDNRPLVPGNIQTLSIWDALLALMWDTRDKGDGTALELATWIYAIEDDAVAGNVAYYDVAGRYNLYLAVGGLYKIFANIAYQLKDQAKTVFRYVYEKDHYAFAPVWDLTQRMIKLLQYYRDQLMELELLLESLPSLMPAPVRLSIEAPQGSL
ncbi:hypothetical protein TWF730_008098 [Orbilia blumenaviensis]|uniref:Uncharacterized protein n=1 Tax=Orbilia blumenaviensis TaxID=1796055 RepID=A0AAV9VAB2_9PEZI